eukprot:g50102.t1
MAHRRKLALLGQAEPFIIFTRTNLLPPPGISSNRPWGGGKLFAQKSECHRKSTSSAGQPKKQKRDGEGLASMGAHEDKEHGGRDGAGEEDDEEGFSVEAKRPVLGGLDGGDEYQTGDSAGEEDDEEGFSVEAKRPVLGGDSAGEEDDEEDGVDPWTARRKEGLDPRTARRKEGVKQGLKAPTPAQIRQFTWEDQGTLQRFRSRLDANLRELLTRKGMAFPEVTFLFGPLYLWLRLSRCKQMSPTDGVWYKTVDVVQMGVDYSVPRQGHCHRLLQELAVALTEIPALKNRRVYYQSATGETGRNFLQKLPWLMSVFFFLQGPREARPTAAPSRGFLPPKHTPSLVLIAVLAGKRILGP